MSLPFLIMRNGIDTIIDSSIYARVSTEEQATEGYSIKAQKDLLIYYAEKNNLTIIADYTDEGKSGKSITGRPHLFYINNGGIGK